MANVLQDATRGNLYEQVAARVTALVEAGTLRVGQRVPSVRKLSEQLDVSISTVIQAYRVLEDGGLIAAKPQSGYYVKARSRAPSPEPAMTKPSAAPTRVTVADLVMKVLRAPNDPSVVPLGAAVPGPQCLPTQQLNRISASISRRMVRTAHTYDAPPGCEALRVQIARRYLEAGCALAPDQIITTCGSTEALTICLQAVAKAGDTVAIETPTYYGILQTIELLGMRALEIPTHPRDGVSLDALKYAIDEKPIKACLFVTNYNNPLGSCVPDASKEKLYRMLAAADVPLIEDDIYGDVGFAAHRAKVCKAFDDRGLVLLCSSFSKTLAPGYRVGWVAPGRYFERVQQLKVMSTLSTPTVPQLTVAEFLADGGYERHLRKVRRSYSQQIQQVTAAVREHFPEGTRVTRPAGGSVLWVQMPEGVDSLELHDRALERKISIAPGPIFSAKQKFRNFVRLNCGHPWSDTLERAVQTLGRLVKEQL